jgi:hypothetical protein
MKSPLGAFTTKIRQEDILNPVISKAHLLEIC